MTDACEELKTSVSEGKSLIAAAVTDKGVQTAASDTFSTMAGNIRNIKSAPNSCASVIEILSWYQSGSTIYVNINSSELTNGYLYMLSYSFRRYDMTTPNYRQHVVSVGRLYNGTFSTSANSSGCIYTRTDTPSSTGAFMQGNAFYGIGGPTISGSTAKIYAVPGNIMSYIQDNSMYNVSLVKFRILD